MEKIRTFESTVDAPTIATELARNGCVIIRGHRGEGHMDKLRGELQPYLDTAPTGKTDFAGHRSRRRNNLLAKSEACREMAIDPLILDVCGRVMGPYCHRFRLHVTSLIELLPGEHAQQLHRDGDIYPFRHPAPPVTLASFWAYSDFTEENGATLIVPGSHLWEHERVPDPCELEHAEMSRGSVLLYTSSVWHGSAANQSNSARTGMALHYNLGWLRQEENQVLSAPPELAKTYSETLQRLIGYDFGGPYLGFVEQGNPHLLVEDGTPQSFDRTDSTLEQNREKLVPLRFGDLYQQ